jgi:hypothetical protein
LFDDVAQDITGLEIGNWKGRRDFLEKAFEHGTIQPAK